MEINELTDAQRDSINGWIADGESLSDIQDKMKEHFDFRMTFMEARILVADLEEAYPPPEPEPEPEPASEPEPAAELAPEPTPAEDTAAALPEVKVTMNPQPVPGTMASGEVEFSDGEQALWYMDESGQMNLKAQTEGYQPGEAELRSFQAELEKIWPS